MRSRERERESLRSQISVMEQAGKRAVVDVKAIERDLRTKLEEWRGLLKKHVPQARQVLKKLLGGPIVLTPRREGKSRFYEFSAPIALGRVLAGMAVANMVASPAGNTPGWNIELKATIRK